MIWETEQCMNFQSVAGLQLMKMMGRSRETFWWEAASRQVKENLVYFYTLLNYLIKKKIVFLNSFVPRMKVNLTLGCFLLIVWLLKK